MTWDKEYSVCTYICKIIIYAWLTHNYLPIWESAMFYVVFCCVFLILPPVIYTLGGLPFPHYLLNIILYPQLYSCILIFCTLDVRWNHSLSEFILINIIWLLNHSLCNLRMDLIWHGIPWWWIIFVPYEVCCGCTQLHQCILWIFKYMFLCWW